MRPQDMRFNFCPRCLPRHTALVGKKDGNPDFVFCEIHGAIPVDEVLNYSEPKNHVTYKGFSTIIKKASQPLKSSSQKEGELNAGGYSGKKTRQRKTVSTSGKRHGKSR